MKQVIPFIVVVISFGACNKSSTPITLTDIDGNVYDTVSIGRQLWMKVNLKTTRYRNGDVIPRVTETTAWDTLTTGAWCWYNNDSATYDAAYGKLYNWFAVNDPRGLAPTGWHIPSDVDWIRLSTFLGGDLIAGGALKEAGTTHWKTPNIGATNNSGFTGLPGGIRATIWSFNSVDGYGHWWSSTENDAANAGFRGLAYDVGSIGGGGGIFADKRLGYSVRCLRY